jgi:hypothetical protein
MKHLSALTMFDHIPAGCILQPVANDDSAPHIHAGEFEARNLAMAVRMMAGSGDLPKDAGIALEVVADLIFEKLIGACDERTRLWKLAGKIAK